MQVLLTLNEPLGADLGPFTITTDVGVVTPSSATRNDLISGIVVNLDDNATTITITSSVNSGCPSNSLVLNIIGKPEPECNCEFYNVTVSNTDILDATGNIGVLEAYNNVVVYRFTNCNDVYQEIIAPDAGTFNNVLCVKDGTTISITYYKNNNELAAISSASETGIPCCN